MPPTDDGSGRTNRLQLLEQWVQDLAHPWPADRRSLESDVASCRQSFRTSQRSLRRIYLDTVGVPPTAEEARSLSVGKANTNKRQRMLINELLKRRAFRRWVDELLARPVSGEPVTAESARWAAPDHFDGSCTIRCATTSRLTAWSPNC